MNHVPIGNEENMEKEAAAPDALQVRELQPVDFSRWDEFVSACPEATFFHRAGWKHVIEEAFGHRTYFLYAEAGGRIEGNIRISDGENDRTIPWQATRQP